MAWTTAGNVFLKNAWMSALLWMVCEVLGGLAFLAVGIRLWTYEMVPVFYAISSPVIWAIAFLLMPPFFYVYDRFEQSKSAMSLRTKVVSRLVFLVVVGCVSEVLINEWIFKRWLGRPLFVYEVLPTFDGSGSYLSPLYYMTLYSHFPLMRALRRPRRA